MSDEALTRARDPDVELASDGELLGVSEMVPRRRAPWIAEQMVAGVWSNELAKQCMIEWCVSRSRVAQIASNARDLLDALGDRTRLSELIMVRMINVAREDGPDRVAALQAVAKQIGLHRMATEEGATRDDVIDAIREPDAEFKSMFIEALQMASTEVRKWYTMALKELR